MTSGIITEANVTNYRQSEQSASKERTLSFSLLSSWPQFPRDFLTCSSECKHQQLQGDSCRRPRVFSGEVKLGVLILESAAEKNFRMSQCEIVGVHREQIFNVVEHSCY